MLLEPSDEAMMAFAKGYVDCVGYKSMDDGGWRATMEGWAVQWEATVSGRVVVPRLLEGQHDRGVEDGLRVQVAQLSQQGYVRTRVGSACVVECVARGGYKERATV